MVTAYPGLTEEKRRRIDRLLIDGELMIARHIGTSNQQAEHIRSCGSVALGTGYWPLLGETIDGDFGWLRSSDTASARKA